MQPVDVDLPLEYEHSSIWPFKQQQHVFFFNFFGFVCILLDIA